MDDTNYAGMFSIWLAPEERWLTVWDFLRRDDQGLEDAIPLFYNAPAAIQAVKRLDPVLQPHCVVRVIVVPPPPPGLV